MAKIILTMQYEVLEEKRSEYFSVIQELKTHHSTNHFVEYSVYEIKGKRNNFTEMFLAHSEESYKKFEESEDEAADTLAEKLTSCINGKIKYATYTETV